MGAVSPKKKLIVTVMKKCDYVNFNQMALK